MPAAVAAVEVAPTASRMTSTCNDSNSSRAGAGVVAVEVAIVTMATTMTRKKRTTLEASRYCPYERMYLLRIFLINGDSVSLL